MKLEDIRFPLYVVHSDEVIRRDGVLWVDGAVLDDTNVEGQSIDCGHFLPEESPIETYNAIIKFFKK